MKKMISLFLVMILSAVTLFALPGDAWADGGSVLDDAFDSDSLVLEKTELPDITADKFDDYSVRWKVRSLIGNLEPVGVDVYISGMEFVWLSLSPAGNSGILSADKDTGVCYYNGQYHFVYPSSRRGVRDRYGNLEKVSSKSFQTFLSEEGFVYSPDGRYAAITPLTYVLNNRQYYFDPIIIDLSTGEMILTATYENKLEYENAGAVTTAAFSSDSRYFYYMLYGNTAKYQTALYRYDIEENETELCYSGSDFNYYPRLCETADGAILILRETGDRSEKAAGITRISYKDGKWVGTEVTFDLPSKNWYGNRLLYSRHSGYAIELGKYDSIKFAFQRIRPDEGFTGLNQYYVVSKEDNQIHAIAVDELKSLFENWRDTQGATEIISADAFRFLPWDRPFHTIATARLSPDGRYVLLNTINDGTRDNRISSRHLYLVRLDDLSIREVRGIDPRKILIDRLAWNYPLEIEWNTDILIIGTEEGIQAYRFRQP